MVGLSYYDLVKTTFTQNGQAVGTTTACPEWQRCQIHGYLRYHTPSPPFLCFLCLTSSIKLEAIISDGFIELQTIISDGATISRGGINEGAIIHCRLCLIGHQDNTRLVDGGGTRRGVLQWIQENKSYTASSRTCLTTFDTLTVAHHLTCSQLMYHTLFSAV